MDFITCLPKFEGKGTIIVVVDRFSKYATFILATKDCNVEETARLFLAHVVKYWGVPKIVVSDRDSLHGAFLDRALQASWHGA